MEVDQQLSGSVLGWGGDCMHQLVRDAVPTVRSDPEPEYHGLAGTRGAPGMFYTRRCTWGRTGSTGLVRLSVASRGAAGLVKSGKNVIANNNYAYAA